jgi:hypothetical protein
LWASQRNDYPVTVKSGHSVSEVILAPDRIGYNGISTPGLVLLLFKEGLPLVQAHLAEMTEDHTLIINSSLLPILTKARIFPIDFSQTGRWAGKKEYWAMIALARGLSILRIYPLQAFREAVSARSEFAADNLAAIETGENLNLQAD